MLEVFRVEGSVSGNVTYGGDLYVGEHGSIDGQVHAGRLMINGLVNGQVEVAGAVVVGSHGRLLADLVAGELHVASGGVVEGKCAIRPLPGADTTESPQRIEEPQRPLSLSQRLLAYLWRSDSADGATSRPVDVRPRAPLGNFQFEDGTYRFRDSLGRIVAEVRTDESLDERDRNPD